MVNKKLVDALNSAKVRIQSVKDKYRNRMSKKCNNCGQSLTGNRHDTSSMGRSDLGSIDYDDVLKEASN